MSFIEENSVCVLNKFRGNCRLFYYREVDYNLAMLFKQPLWKGFFPSPTSSSPNYHSLELSPSDTYASSFYMAKMHPTICEAIYWENQSGLKLANVKNKKVYHEDCTDIKRITQEY